MTADTVSSLAGGLSGLWRHVLDMIYSQQPSFFRGIALPANSRCSAKRLFRARIQFVIQDEFAIRSTLLNKGSSGSCPCPMCLNVYGGAADAAIPAHSRVYHFANCLPHQFEPVSGETVWNTVDFLASRSGDSAARRAELSQNLGSGPCNASDCKSNSQRGAMMHRRLQEPGQQPSSKQSRAAFADVGLRVWLVSRFPRCKIRMASLRFWAGGLQGVAPSLWSSSASVLGLASHLYMFNWNLSDC